MIGSCACRTISPSGSTLSSNPVESTGPTTSTRIAFEAYGVGCAVEVEHACAPAECREPDLVARVLERLPPGSSTTDAPVALAGQVTITCRGERFEVTDSEGTARSFGDVVDALHVLDGAIRSIVAVHAPGLVFIHAGAVAIDGRVLVLPGRSMTGKTTLVAALVEAGATYLSDEYAVFDAHGDVHPYPRRLSVRRPEGRREVSVDQIGGVTAAGPLPPIGVAALAHVAGGTFAVSEPGQAACAQALIANAVAARIRPTEVLQVAASVARGLRFVEGTRGDVADAVPAVFALVRRWSTDRPGGSTEVTGDRR